MSERQLRRLYRLVPAPGQVNAGQLICTNASKCNKGHTKAGAMYCMHSVPHTEAYHCVEGTICGAANLLVYCRAYQPRCRTCGRFLPAYKNTTVPMRRKRCWPCFSRWLSESFAAPCATGKRAL